MMRHARNGGRTNEPETLSFFVDATRHGSSVYLLLLQSDTISDMQRAKRRCSWVFNLQQSTIGVPALSDPRSAFVFTLESNDTKMIAEVTT